jgi:hypothetical protein
VAAWHVPRQTVTVKRQGKNGKLLTKMDTMGGVFALVPGKRLLPAYGIGPANAKEKTPMFTCPVSGIPDEVWQLLNLWRSCRVMKTLPNAGGFLDQSPVVQRTFPVFDAIADAAEPKQGGQEQMAMMLAAMMKTTAGRK